MDEYVSPGTFTPSVAKRFELTAEKKALLIYAAGAGAGACQTLLLRKYMDITPPTWYPSFFTSLGNLGKPSSIFGIIGGSIGLVGGLFFIRDTRVRNALVAYGGGALLSGLASGLELV
jgi:hypothetical protein